MGSARYNNSQIYDGVGWNQKYDVAAATAALFLNVLVVTGDKSEKVIGWYDSATAFSSSAKAACISFPKGSIVYDIQAKVIWLKIAAAGTDTWAYSATLT
jgi:hypothetical protein